MARLIIDGFSKYFGDVKAVDNVNITVEDGEFLTLLGPSGCGKSTTLFAIAGLDQPSAGRMILGETVLSDAERGIFMEPENRNCGLVFQSYALWPHMTVKQNLSFPLEIRKTPKAEKEKRILEVLGLVEMEDYVDRYPHELSGGQQQRVSLARTLVYEPRLLLLDEPLSNLDAKLRIKARSWLKQLQTRLGLTTVYVTHDQSEALSLSDRIAIMNKGELVQLDTPENIYRRPASSFVADFIGNSNFVTAEVREISPEQCKVTMGDTVINCMGRNGIKVGERVTVAIRPENIRPVSPGSSNDVKEDNLLKGQIVSREYLGSRFQYFIDLGAGNELRMECDQNFEDGEIGICFDAGDSLLFAE